MPVSRNLLHFHTMKGGGGVKFGGIRKLYPSMFQNVINDNYIYVDFRTYNKLTNALKRLSYVVNFFKLL